jgi:IS5 family transposase
MVFRYEAASRSRQKTKLIHSMTTTAANVHDANVLGQLLHGKETRV